MMSLSQARRLGPWKEVSTTQGQRVTLRLDCEKSEPRTVTIEDLAVQ